jgi:hypothetical protein
MYGFAGGFFGNAESGVTLDPTRSYIDYSRLLNIKDAIVYPQALFLLNTRTGRFAV